VVDVCPVVNVLTVVNVCTVVYVCTVVDVCTVVYVCPVVNVRPAVKGLTVIQRGRQVTIPPSPRGNRWSYIFYHFNTVKIATYRGGKLLLKRRRRRRRRKKEGHSFNNKALVALSI